MIVILFYDVFTFSMQPFLWHCIVSLLGGELQLKAIGSHRFRSSSSSYHLSFVCIATILIVTITQFNSIKLTPPNRMFMEIAHATIQNSTLKGGSRKYPFTSTRENIDHSALIICIYVMTQDIFPQEHCSHFCP